MQIPLDRKQILGGSARRFSPKTQLHFGYGAMPGVENTNPPGRAFPGPHATKGRKREMAAYCGCRTGPIRHVNFSR
jgi:hypothetical protein